jgi:histidinol-phosphate aminotransferase
VTDRSLTTSLMRQLPPTVPFVGPEAIERSLGWPLDLRLGANESLFGLSARAREAMRAAVDEVALYGDPENFELRAALARHHGVGEREIVVAAGIDDLLGLIVRAAVAPGDTAVMSLGAYPTLAYHVVGYGGQLERPPYREDRNDLDALLAAVARTSARLVYLANPDNPSGTWHSASDVLTFAERLPPDCVFALDEAYADFAPESALPPVSAERPNLLRLRTFSKAHGMAGARIGYGIGHAATIAEFEKIRLHFGVNRIAQAGALASLADQEHLRMVIDAVAEGRQAYQEMSGRLGLITIPSATNFVAIDVGGRERATALVQALARRGAFVRMPGAPPLDRCIRVTVGTPPQRAAFADLFAELSNTL